MSVIGMIAFSEARAMSDHWVSRRDERESQCQQNAALLRNPATHSPR